MLEFFCFETLPSTQKWLVDYLKKTQKVSPLICVMCDLQTLGIGSRDNRWDSVESALTFSFSFDRAKLPQDFPLQSSSIYVGFLFKEFLVDYGFDVWLKWPNDLYLQKQKIGGVLTQIVGERLVCGIGLNLDSKVYASLGLHLEVRQKREMIEKFLNFFLNFPSWNDIFQKYKLEFHKNYGFTFHFRHLKLCFSEVELCEDGSIVFENQKIYSLR